jgi:hypothetical protein
MRPSELPGSALLSADEARAEARRLGVPLVVPSAARLADGSALVATQAAAVALTHVSPACARALVAQRGDLFRATAVAAAAVARQPLAEDACAALMQALAAMPMPGACDASLVAAATQAASLLARREGAARAAQRVELAHAQHAEQLRALQRDLKALEAVLKLDAAAVDAARGRRQALLQSSAQPLAAAAWALSQKLARLEEVAARLR